MSEVRVVFMGWQTRVTHVGLAQNRGFAQLFVSHGAAGVLVVQNSQGT